MRIDWHRLRGSFYHTAYDCLTFLVQGCLTQLSTPQPPIAAGLTQWPPQATSTAWDLRWGPGGTLHSLVTGINELGNSDVGFVILLNRFLSRVGTALPRDLCIQLRYSVCPLSLRACSAWIVAQLPPNSQLNISARSVPDAGSPHLLRGLNHLTCACQFSPPYHFYWLAFSFPLLRKWCNSLFLKKPWWDLAQIQNNISTNRKVYQSSKNCKDEVYSVIVLV